MKLSIDRINEVIQKGQSLEDSKLKFTFDKFVKRVTEANKIATDKFNEQAEDLRVDFCSVDEKGNIIRDEKGGYLFTKENQKACMKALKAIQVTELEFEFNPMLATPEGLTREQREAFSEVLIPEQKEIDVFIYTSENGLDNVCIEGDITELEKKSITEQIKAMPELQ